MKNDDFFVGAAHEIPQQDRRFFLRSAAALSLLSAAGGFVLAKSQRGPGNGGWNFEEREWRGTLLAEPYAMLITEDFDGQERPVLLACPIKCGVKLKVSEFDGQSVVIKGSLIHRDGNAMIAVSEAPDWIVTTGDAGVDSRSFAANHVSLGGVTYNGEILDSKCWFGAMRPGYGKPHKSCASLCIRGGIPPALFVRNKSNQPSLMLLTENKTSFGMSILSFVGEPVAIEGELLQWNNLLFLDSAAGAIKRV